MDWVSYARDDITRHIVAVEIISAACPLNARAPSVAASHPALHPVDAIGILKASLYCDDGLGRSTFEDAVILSAATGGGEDAILHGFSQEMSRLGRPLILTYGGRRRVLPILRHRALARGVPLHVLRTTAGNGAYFSRFNPDWHFDLEDVLAGTGAIAPLPLDDLCHAMGLGSLDPGELEAPTQMLTVRLVATYAIYLRYLAMLGCMLPSCTERALRELSDVEPLCSMAAESPALTHLLEALRISPLDAPVGNERIRRPGAEELQHPTA